MGFSDGEQDEERLTRTLQSFLPEQLLVRATITEAESPYLEKVRRGSSEYSWGHVGFKVSIQRHPNGDT